MAKLSRRLTLVLLALATTAHAQNARFDLVGPKIEVRVTRGGVTLPIASVPNLQPGDRLWLHPDLPDTQSVRYLMVLVFLRGTTNPPPDQWFTRIEAWDKKVRAEGVSVTVPDEAQQAVLFLAPVTGGDFTTLRSAVQGRPGVFVRAVQDLNLASFDLARTEKYLAAMRELPPDDETDPKRLLDDSNRIAGTLALKPNPDCFKLPADQQYTCLTLAGNQTLLDDGHGETVVDALTGNAGAGLISNAASTQLAGNGVYSAYVGTIVDFVHIMGSLHTAQYQYIPAIAFPQQQSLNLRLNTPPSFHNPKSVIVIGLPSIQPSVAPPLRPTDAKLVACLEKPNLVLQLEGAPLVFSTGFAHDLVLHLNAPAGSPGDAKQTQDIPLTPNAYQGGLILATVPQRHPLPAEPLNPSAQLNPSASPTPDPAFAKQNSPQLTGTIRGFWGFDAFSGPTLPLQNAPGKDWKLVGSDPLIAGHDRHIQLTATATGCIQSIALEPAPGGLQNEKWRPSDKPDTVDLALDLPERDTASLHLTIRQYGAPDPEAVSLTTYHEPARLEALHFHAGDTAATLSGTSLDEVSQLRFGGAAFKQAAGPAAPVNGNADLRMELVEPASTSRLTPGERLTAKVELKDGRTLTMPLTVEPPRPALTLLSKTSSPVPDAPTATHQPATLRIYLGNDDDLPINQQLSFSLKSAQPFPRTGQVEIANLDDSLHATLSVASGTLILQDPKTVVATVDPLKTFGTSAFGPIRLRAIAPDGTPGDWLPLATLVRLPNLTGLSCPAPPAPSKPSRKNATPPLAASAPSAEKRSTDPDAAIAQPASLSSNPSHPNDPPAAATPADPPANPADPPSPDTSVQTQPTPSPASPAAPPPPCTLTGSSLYLIDAISPDPAFTNPTQVPEGFVGSSLSVPPPTGPDLYLRLRDDPSAANTVALPAGPL
jgi:hypothetical protein